MGNLRALKLGRAVYKVNKATGYFPYFSLTLRQRIKRRMACNIAVVGEAGIGKSYAAFTYCLALDKKFSVDQIVYRYSSYMHLIRTLGLGRHVMFDEPSYAIGKRDWYKELNKVLVKTIESQRFKVHPLWIPIINMTLLDKTIREHLIQYVILVLNRGFSYVYRIYPSQWEDKIYHPYFCTLKFPLLSKCPTKWFPKSKDSCLGCTRLKECQTFRAQYERKKASVQNTRYAQAEVEASRMESKEFTTQQLAHLAHQFRVDYVNEDKQINVRRMRTLLMKQLKLHISIGKGYDIKDWLLMEYPDDYIDSA